MPLRFSTLWLAAVVVAVVTMVGAVVEQVVLELRLVFLLPLERLTPLLLEPVETAVLEFLRANLGLLEGIRYSQPLPLLEAAAGRVELMLVLLAVKTELLVVLAEAVLATQVIAEQVAHLLR